MLPAANSSRDPHETFKAPPATALLYGVSVVAVAATIPISVHVLNLQDGLLSPSVSVTLEECEGSRWKLHSTTVRATYLVEVHHREG